MDFVKLEKPQEALTQEIRERAATSSVAICTTQYSVRESGEEVGYVAIDILGESEAMTLYEIYVPTQLRHCGIGGRILQEAERFSQRLGFTAITLRPKPLESYPQLKLIEWNKKHGYVEHRDCSPLELKKTFGGVNADEAP
jgi:hypothetical protein